MKREMILRLKDIEKFTNVNQRGLLRTLRKLSEQKEIVVFKLNDRSSVYGLHIYNN